MYYIEDNLNLYGSCILQMYVKRTVSRTIDCVFVCMDV